MVILDTSIIIDHLRQQKKQSFLEEFASENPKEILALSILSIQELYEGASTLNPEKEKNLLAIIAPLKILPYTFEIAQLGGEIARDSKRPLELADAALAATAIINGCQLLSLNKKDFNHIKDLELI